MFRHITVDRICIIYDSHYIKLAMRTVYEIVYSTDIPLFSISQETHLNFMLKLQEISRYNSCGSNLYRATDHTLYWFVGHTWKNNSKWCRGQLKCDGTHAETRFCLSAKWTSPFKSAGASVRSTTDS